MELIHSARRQRRSHATSKVSDRQPDIPQSHIGQELLPFGCEPESSSPETKQANARPRPKCSLTRSHGDHIGCSRGIASAGHDRIVPKDETRLWGDVVLLMSSEIACQDCYWGNLLIVGRAIWCSGTATFDSSIAGRRYGDWPVTKRSREEDQLGLRRRLELTRAQWLRIKRLLLGKKGDLSRTTADNRPFVDAVLQELKTGIPWKDLPPRTGKANPVWRRLDRRCGNGVRERIARSL